jgi:hypothetical protein
MEAEIAALLTQTLQSEDVHVAESALETLCSSPDFLPSLLGVFSDSSLPDPVRVRGVSGVFSHHDGQRRPIMWPCAGAWEEINLTVEEMSEPTCNASQSHEMTDSGTRGDKCANRTVH